jgi:predicted membrane channel-forming protein YqfA (hemolysin III family)
MLFVSVTEQITSLLNIYLFFSLFRLTNETINIWTHLLGSLVFFFLLIYSNAVTIPDSLGGYADHVVFTSFLLLYQVGQSLTSQCDINTPGLLLRK